MIGLKEHMIPMYGLRCAGIVVVAVIMLAQFLAGYYLFGIMLLGMVVCGLLNTLVIFVNGGRMPKLLYKNEKEKPESWGEVAPRGEKVWELVGRGKKEIAFDGSVRLKFLADRFRVPRLDSVFSLGDFISYASALPLLLWAILA